MAFEMPAILKIRLKADCPTHSRTEISARQHKVLIDEPPSRDGTRNGHTGDRPSDQTAHGLQQSAEGSGPHGRPRLEQRRGDRERGGQDELFDVEALHHRLPRTDDEHERCDRRDRSLQSASGWSDPG